MKYILMISLLVLASCGTQKTTFVATPVERAPVIAPSTTPIRVRDVPWQVMTSKEVIEKAKELEATPDPNYTIFVLTPRGFENLSQNLNETRRFIREQKQVIIFYKNVVDTK